MKNRNIEFFLNTAMQSNKDVEVAIRLIEDWIISPQEVFDNLK